MTAAVWLSGWHTHPLHKPGVLRLLRAFAGGRSSSCSDNPVTCEGEGVRCGHTPPRPKSINWPLPSLPLSFLYRVLPCLLSPRPFSSPCSISLFVNFLTLIHAILVAPPRDPSISKYASSVELAIKPCPSNIQHATLCPQTSVASVRQENFDCVLKLW